MYKVLCSSSNFCRRMYAFVFVTYLFHPFCSVIFSFCPIKLIEHSTLNQIRVSLFLINQTGDCTLYTCTPIQSTDYFIISSYLEVCIYYTILLNMRSISFECIFRPKKHWKISQSVEFLSSVHIFHPYAWFE